MTGEQQESPPPQANVLVNFRDGRGREWMAAGWLGPLVRYEDGKMVESMLPGQTKEKEMAITGLQVVERP